jgi:GrpB-like predicted nucleotidyltransferase (UPF0157 family)
LVTEDPVDLVPYDLHWPALFQVEAKLLIAGLGSSSFTIEHVGSTAIPGLGAKPVVDLMLGGPSLAAIDARRPAIEHLGYEYRPHQEAVIPDRRFFVKSVGGRRAFHLHAVQAGSAFWVEHVAFRDRLRSDPGLAAAYHGVKADLAARHRHDREAYTSGKSAFISTVLGSVKRRPSDDAV